MGRVQRPPSTSLDSPVVRVRVDSQKCLQRAEVVHRIPHSAKGQDSPRDFVPPHYHAVCDDSQSDGRGQGTILSADLGVRHDLGLGLLILHRVVDLCGHHQL